MFDNTCTACHRRQLIFPSQVTGITNTAEGILVAYTCWCGADQTWLTGNAARTGSERATDRGVAVAA